MEEILHQLIGSLSRYLPGFIQPKWCRISFSNSRTQKQTSLHAIWSVCWMTAATQIPSFWTLVLCCHAGPTAFGKLQCIGSCQHLKIQGSAGFQCQCARWGPGTWNRGKSVRHNEHSWECPLSSWMKDLPKISSNIACSLLPTVCTCSTCVHVPLEPALYIFSIYIYIYLWNSRHILHDTDNCSFTDARLTQYVILILPQTCFGEELNFSKTSHSDLTKATETQANVNALEITLPLMTMYRPWIIRDLYISTLHMFTEENAYEVQLPPKIDCHESFPGNWHSPC